jgi:hypothetical protein
VLTPVQFFFGSLPGAVAKAVGDFFTTAWADLLTVASWLNTNVLTPVTSFFGGLPGDVKKIIVSFYDTAFSDLTTIGTWLENNVWNPIGAFFSGLESRIATVAEGMWNGVANAFISALNDVINAWDSLHFTLPSVDVFGLHLGGGTIGTPNIPDIPLIGKAAGGDVLPNTSYLVGELGPEVITLGAMGGYVTPNHDLSSLAAAGRGPRQPDYVQHVEHMTIESQADANAMAQALGFLSRTRRL